MEETNKTEIKLIKVPTGDERIKIEKKRKTIRTILLSLIVLFLVVGAFFGGYLTSSLTKDNKTVTSESKFDKILNLMKTEWLYASDYEDIEKTLNDMAYYGMTEFEDDPYTTYMSSEDLESFTNGINMDYVGIGVQYISVNKVPEIIKVFKDSPAELAGLLPGDIITAVDGLVIDESNLADLKSYVLGEEGTIVRISVLRGSEELDFDVTRGEVDSTVYGEERDGYDYLEIISFGEGTPKEVDSFLGQFSSGKLVLDLRDDSGGYQNAVATIAGLFIGPNKVYMKQVKSDGVVYDDYTSSIIDPYYFDEIIILVNENTASAAEVLTICLKEQLDNVTIVGNTTFGKGVVQSTFMVEGDSAVKITTSKWLSPVNGIWINGEGIKPDVEVLLPEIFYETYEIMEDDDSYSYDDCSTYIKTAEMCLEYLGYEVDRTDGYFSRIAIEALSEYKSDQNMENGEVLDKSTYNALITAVTHEYYVNKEKDIQLLKAEELLGE